MLTSGTLSPLHTRRRTQSDDAPRNLPYFAEALIGEVCDKILERMAETDVRDVEWHVLNLVSFLFPRHLLLVKA